MTELPESLKKTLGIDLNVVSDTPSVVNTLDLTKIYELNEKQVNILTGACAIKGCAFVVFGALDSDPEDRQIAIAKESKEIGDLEQLGLIENISNKFTDTIKLAKQSSNGRDFKIYRLTPEAYLMFLPKERTIQ